MLTAQNRSAAPLEDDSNALISDAAPQGTPATQQAKAAPSIPKPADPGAIGSIGSIGGGGVPGTVAPASGPSSGVQPLDMSGGLLSNMAGGALQPTPASPPPIGGALAGMAGGTLSPAPAVAPPVTAGPGIEAAPSGSAVNSQIGLQPLTMGPVGTQGSVQPLSGGTDNPRGGLPGSLGDGDAAPQNPSPTSATSPTAPGAIPTANGFKESYDAVMAGNDDAMKKLYQWQLDNGYAGKNVGFGSDGSIIDEDTGKTVKGPNGQVQGIVDAANKPTGTYTPPDIGPARYLQNGLETDAQGAPVAGGYNALSDIYRELGTTPGSVNPQVLDLVKQNPSLVGALPTGGDTLARTLQSMGITLGGTGTPSGAPGASSAPSGSAAGPNGLAVPARARDVGTPSSQGGAIGQVSPSGAPTGAPAGGAAGPSGLSPSSGGSGAGAAPMGHTGNAVLDSLLSGSNGASTPSLTNTDPNNALTTKTIGAPAQNDPVQMALSAYNTFRQSTDPQYQADLRDATRHAAATGTIGSGSLNTSLGNIANTRQNTLSTEEQGLLNGALGTQNENAYRNTGIAQQQQGFQQGQQDTAFNQALQQAMYGSQGDPSQLGLALSAIFGQQANQAGSNLGSLISGSTQNGSTQQILQQILGGLTGGGGSSTAVDPETQKILDSILQGGVPGMQTTGSY